MGIVLWALYTGRLFPKWYVDEQRAEITRLKVLDESWRSLITRIVKPILPKDE